MWEHPGPCVWTQFLGPVLWGPIRAATWNKGAQCEATRTWCPFTDLSWIWWVGTTYEENFLVSVDARVPGPCVPFLPYHNPKSPRVGRSRLLTKPPSTLKGGNNQKETMCLTPFPLKLKPKQYDTRVSLDLRLSTDKHFGLGAQWHHRSMDPLTGDHNWVWRKKSCTTVMALEQED